MLKPLRWADSSELKSDTITLKLTVDCFLTFLKPPKISEVFYLNFSKNNEGVKYKSPETTQNELRESLGVRDDKTHPIMIKKPPSSLFWLANQPLI